MQTLDVLSKIGPFLSGVALLAGSAAAWATLIFYHRKTLYSQWVDGFRLIYAEFWKDEGISKVRRLITNDSEYENLKNVLEQRLLTTNNDLSVEQNDMLELVDRYLALMSRVVSFNKARMNEEQGELWNSLFERFWIAKMYKRPELTMYVRAYWKYLYSSTYDRIVSTNHKTSDR